MAKFTDFEVTDEICEIMGNWLDKCPENFTNGFDLNQILFVHTKGKKNKSHIKLHPVRYPVDVWLTKTYIVEVFEDTWRELSQKVREKKVFRLMCSVAEDGFDESSDNYGKKRKPDYEAYKAEVDYFKDDKLDWEFSGECTGLPDDIPERRAVSKAVSKADETAEESTKKGKKKSKAREDAEDDESDEAVQVGEEVDTEEESDTEEEIEREAISA